jgi:hypothetical protein
MPFSAPLAVAGTPSAALVFADDPCAWTWVVCAGEFCEENLELTGSGFGGRDATWLLRLIGAGSAQQRWALGGDLLCWRRYRWCGSRG